MNNRLKVVSKSQWENGTDKLNVADEGPSHGDFLSQLDSKDKISHA